MNTKIAITGGLALILGFVGGVWLSSDGPAVGEAEASVYRCPMHPTVISDRPTECPICGMDMVPDAPEHAGHDTMTDPSERKVLYWRAPMDPNYVTKVPGKSPMGMDLIPVYEDEVMGGASVTIDPITIQNIGVKTTRVRRENLRRTIRTVGRVDYNETRMTDVNTKVDGWVENLFVDFTGQVVKKGQPLLKIFSPELVAAQEEYLTTLDYVRRLSKNASRDALEGGQSLLSSTRQRLLYWDITEDQITRLEKAGTVKRTMVVYSPQEGVVVHKAVFNGAHIKAGQHLYRIADLSKVWVYADIYEYELPWLRTGQAAEVELSYEPGKTFTGEVTFIYPSLEAKTRTVKVRMDFDNPSFELKPEMYANVRIHSTVARDALVIPSQSVIRSGERNVVVLALGEGRFKPVDVTLGVETNGDIEVLEGLREGDDIVVSSQFLIDSESNLKAALLAMTGEKDIEDVRKKIDD
jgi:Cu(I)/Ag(I) efflux system membrane fusion protein/cobalt-zinc-cadmium efflux system membrane fusion protein